MSQRSSDSVRNFSPPGMGWIPDVPDLRDYNVGHAKINAWLRRLSIPSTEILPDEVDLRYGDEGEYFLTESRNQGSANSSAAFATLSLVEYFERRMKSRTFDGSPLFLQKMARNIRSRGQEVGEDLGADLRTALKALVRFGVPAEELWPYEIARRNDEPGAFVYQSTRSFSEIRYFRVIDPLPSLSRHSRKRKWRETSRWQTLTAFLAAGFPVAFGFSVPASLTFDKNIVYREGLDSIRGGQVVLAIGYKQDLFGKNHHGLLIRNSWGREWGDDGNGWLSSSFVQRGLAGDFWTLISKSWLNRGELTRPLVPLDFQ